MKKKIIIWVYLFILIGIALIFTNSCVNVIIIQVPILTTSDVLEITDTTAICGGHISSDGGAKVTSFGVCWSTNPNPTIENNKTTNCINVDSFTCKIIELSANTTYYIKAYATNSVGTAYGEEVSFITTYKEQAKDVTDIEGNVYKTVTIGTQVWMAENLKTTKYRNGDPIGTTNPATLDISNETAPKYQWASGSYEGNVAIYGRLYTWYVVDDSRCLCPAGWHVPTEGEWIIMREYLIANSYNYNGSTTDNKIAKSLAATTRWNSSPIEGYVGSTYYPEYRNKTGFNALPCGDRYEGGIFDHIGITACWWSSSKSGTNSANCWYFYYYSVPLGNFNFSMSDGYSVRCVKD
jgi:uncharacterized protein (TIGR02145 family)